MPGLVPGIAFCRVGDGRFDVAHADKKQAPTMRVGEIASAISPTLVWG
jgi:hypothetical protein